MEEQLEKILQELLEHYKADDDFDYVAYAIGEIERLYADKEFSEEDIKKSVVKIIKLSEEDAYYNKRDCIEGKEFYMDGTRFYYKNKQDELALNKKYFCPTQKLGWGYVFLATTRFATIKKARKQ